jgi:hypothetical protein
MMPGGMSFTWDGLKRTLNDLTANWGTLTVHLFKNDHEPVIDDTVSAYVEADYSGYATVDLTNPQPAERHFNRAVTSQYDDVEFRHNGGTVQNDTYGYFITQRQGMGTPILLYATRFPNVPLRMSQLNDHVIIVLLARLRDGS